MNAANSNAQAWSDARRILCVRADNLGDLLMTTPALRALKAGRLDRHLTLLGSSSAAQAAANIPEIDAVIPYAAPWVSRPSGEQHEAPADRRIAGVLKNGEFDAAVIFTVYSQSPLPAAVMCRLAGIPLVLAYCRENPYELLSDWLPETEPQDQQRHEVQRQLDLVAAIGARADDERLSFRVGDATRAALAVRLAADGVDVAQPWVLIHPGATAASRRYAPRQFAAAADLIARQLQCPVVFNGTRCERELVESIRAMMQSTSLSLAGELALAETAAAIELAQVLVANNSGAVHLAAALGTPVVDLYALTNPQHAPWRVPHRVLFYDVPCRNCRKSVCPQGHHDCLNMVAPERVAKAVAELCAAHPRPDHGLVYREAA